MLPKASQHKRVADLRVVVIGGRATHAVVRTSRSPMTNLHLGGVRGDLATARAAAEAAGVAWSEVLGTAERAAACFPGTLCVGVDLLPGIGWRRFAVGEVNAFGDPLPRLTGLPGSGAEGQDTYAAGGRRDPRPRGARNAPAARRARSNLYDGSCRAALRPRPRPLAVCDRHIGCVHLESLPLYDVFAGGVLERIPAEPAGHASRGLQLLRPTPP